jgi:H+/gluconate symporter-like permease
MVTVAQYAEDIVRMFLYGFGIGIFVGIILSYIFKKFKKKKEPKPVSLSQPETKGLT